LALTDKVAAIAPDTSTSAAGLPAEAPKGMPNVLMRFDMRAPEWGAPAPELYATALEMAEWSEVEERSQRSCANTTG
jgi:hypothetical protein